MPSESVNGTEIHYQLLGEGDPALTLIHGGWLDSRAWDQHVDRLSGDRRVLIPDMRGYGRSGALSQPWQVTDWSQDLVALWEALGIGRSHLLGFSMGGPIALGVVTMAAERVASLMLVSTTSRFSDAVREMYLKAATASEEGDYENALARHVEVAFAPEFAARAPDFIAAYEAMARQTGAATVRDTMIALAGVDFVADLPGIDLPTLVVRGSADVITGADHASVLLEGLPRARGVEIEGAGHTLHLERPDAFVELICDFLDEVEDEDAK